MARVSARDLAWRLRAPLPPAAPSWSPAVPDDLVIRWPEAYEWPLAATWVDGLAEDLGRLAPLVRAPIPQVDKLVNFEVDLGGARHEVAIDYGDLERLLDGVAERFPLVFKLQHLREGYGAEHVIPGGYVVSRPALYRFAGPARAAAGPRRRYDVFGRFSLKHAPELRQEVVGRLRAQERFGFEGDVRLTGFAEYLTDAARARICLDLPGKGDLCHRTVEYLALGCCVVRPQPVVRLPVDLVDGEHVAYFRRDLSDLLDVCAGLLADDGRRERIEAGARDYFARYLHREQLARYYLDRVVEILA